MKIVTISDITKFGNSLAQSIRRNLQWSKQLRKSVVLGTAKDSNGVVSISVSVGNGLDKSGMPLTGMAGAYEYGSGIHSTQGNASKYKITARKAKYLYFLTPGYNTPFIGKSVMHPGVKQREYLRKSYDSIRARATDELKMSIRRNIINSLNVTIKEINRK